MNRIFSHLPITLLVTLIMSLPINAQTNWVKVSNQECIYYEPYYEEGFSATWNGMVSNGKANGTGILEKYKNGERYGIYEGSIIDGRIQGPGTYTSFREDGSKSVENGYFENGELLGEGSIIGYLPNGQKSVYNGFIVNSYMHGKGRLDHFSGDTFEGLFYMGDPYTGKGKSDGKTIWLYRGSYVDKLPKASRVPYSPQLFKEQTEYFDEKWNRCDIKKAKYYRKITYKAPNRPLGVVKDFYMSGKLQSEFTALYIDYDDDNLTFHNGEVVFYYENGQVSRKCAYKDNKIIGEDFNYYENGAPASITKYDNNGVKVSHKSWYKSGKPNVIADYKDGRLVNDRYTEYDENGISCQVMQENFDLNKQEWNIDNDFVKSQVISPNVVRIKAATNTGAIATNYIQMNQNQDYSFEGTVFLMDEKNNNVGYGLVLGGKDDNNCLFFVVSSDGQYMIQNIYEGINIPIKEWTFSTAVNRGQSKNLLKVFKIGDKMVFSINGTIVERIDALFFRGSRFGMICGGQGDFALQDLTYKEYLASNTTTSSSQSTNVSSPSSSDSSNDISIDGNGTGFFIDKRGYLATNYHVIEGAKGIYACIQKEGIWKSYHAIVVKSDPINDLSILRIDDPEFEQFPYLPYNFTSDVADIASDIFTLGYPKVNVMGSDVKYTAGTINSITGIQGDPTHYQISAHIDHGNSGGPMFNSNGAIIGITDSGLDKAEFGDVNYALKSSYLKSLIDALPIKLSLPSDKTIGTLKRVDQIKILSKYTALILVDLP